MQKNTASQKVTLLAIDTSTNTPKTGDAANLTAYVSKDDGAVTVLGDTSATELDATNAPGLYAFDLTQTETNAHKLVFSGKSSTANIKLVPQIVYTTPANFALFSIAASGEALGDVTKWAGVGVDINANNYPAVAAMNISDSDANDRIPAALVGGRMDSSVGAMAANVMTAAAAAADLTTELQSGLATAASITSLVNDYLNHAEHGLTVIAGDTLSLVNRVGVPSNLGGGATIAANLAGIDTVTDKLNTALELDGAVYRFTVNALEQAPAGVGGGGDPWATDLSAGGYVAGQAGFVVLNMQEVLGDLQDGRLVLTADQATALQAWLVNTSGNSIDDLTNPAQVDNTDIVPARVFTLSRRHDGTLVANGTCRMRVGETFPVWINTAPLAARWLASADDEASSNPNGVSITSVGINQTFVVLWLTALAAGSYTVEATAHIRAADNLICELAVEVSA
jgi:hypothetical protein